MMDDSGPVGQLLRDRVSKQALETAIAISVAEPR